MKAKAFIALIAVLVGLIPGASAFPDDSRAGGRRSGPDSLRLALNRGAIDEAEYSLERANSIFRLRSVRDRWGHVNRPDPHSATLLLRDLASNLGDLSGSDRTQARRILARPSDGASDPQGHGWEQDTNRQSCQTKTDNSNNELDVCFNWVDEPGDADAPNLADTGPGGTPNNLPDFIDSVQTAFNQVWEREINQLGYRMPLPDGGTANEGGTPGLDIYVADLGEDRVYGYCTTDSPSASLTQSAYCVIDNDFAKEDFQPSIHGLKAMRVTLAHEFFHAVQFAYDWSERKFFMEGTAVWMEDEVFDGINANYEFLHDSPLHQPEISLDAGDWRYDENFEYGSWLFWRYLSEDYSDDLIGNTWESAEGDTDVFVALENELQVVGSSIAKAYSYFAGWNRLVDKHYSALLNYEEGYEYLTAVDYYWPPPDAQHWLGRGHRSTGLRSLNLDHLSMRYVFIDDLTSPARGAKLDISVDPPNPGVGNPTVIVTAGKFTDDYDTTKLCVKWFELDNYQNGVARGVVPFASVPNCVGKRRPVLWVTLVLSNGSFEDDAQFTYKAKLAS